MKKQTLSILLALVMILSVSVFSVCAQTADETDFYDESVIMSVFSDLENLYPGLFSEDGQYFGDSFSGAMDFGSINAEADFWPSESGGYESKAWVNAANSTVTGTYTPCGDGRIWLDIILDRDDVNASGPKFLTYLRGIRVRASYISAVDNTTEIVVVNNASLEECKAGWGDKCTEISFDANGKARVRGYVLANQVLTNTGIKDNKINVSVSIKNSPYMTIFSGVPDNVITVAGEAKSETKHMCQGNFDVYPSGSPIRGYYTVGGEKAEFRIGIQNTLSTTNLSYVIPGEVNVAGYIYKKYICKYTRYSPQGQPSSDYCKPGETFVMTPNEVVRFTIELSLKNPLKVTCSGNNLPVIFRMGGLTGLLTGELQPKVCSDATCVCSDKIRPMDPVKPFLNFYNESDSAIYPSGPYKVYNNAVAGVYQKCGKYAKIAIRLRNFGVRPGKINLPGAVAINGGAPMAFNWVLASVVPSGQSLIVLDPEQDVILLGMAKVTDIPSQMNSDAPISVAVNFADLGLYMTGKLISDRDNTRCYPAP